MQARTPWYPGAVDRLRKVVSENPTAEVYHGAGSTDDVSSPLLENAGTGFFPWIFVPGAPIDPPPSFFRDEFFAGALVEVALDANGPENFLRAAVDFANDTLWGTLSCSMFVPPDVGQAAVEEAVSILRYGSVNVNTITAMGYFFSPCTWGGYTGHKPEDIQSGIGIIHNTLFLDNVEKSVVWGGQLPYTPFWYYTHANAEALGRRLGPFFAWGNLWNFVKTAFSGLRG